LRQGEHEDEVEEQLERGDPAALAQHGQQPRAGLGGGAHRPNPASAGLLPERR